MNTEATIEPFVAAMRRATVIASGTARWIWFTATVIAVNVNSAAPILKYRPTRLATCWASECMSDPLEEVEHREQEDPHQIDEVPVQSGVFDPVGELLGILAPQLRAGADEVRHHDHPAHDVQPVQPGQ